MTPSIGYFERQQIWLRTVLVRWDRLGEPTWIKAKDIGPPE
jgi:hypothetical protein